MQRLFFAAVMLLCAGHSAAQQFATSLKSTEVIPGMLMLEGADGFAGGNMALLVGEQHVVLIDDGIEPIGPLLIEAAREYAGRDIDFVINTHVHGDHAGSNSTMADSGAVIVAHDNILKRLLADSSPAGGEGGLPVVTFSDAVTFHLNGLKAHVMHVATAHTDGDAVIHFPDANVIHTGDIFFNDLYPFIDMDNGGNVAGYAAAQQQLLAIADDDTIIIPGHGPLARKADLAAANAMLVDAEKRVKALLDKGMSAEEVLAAQPLALYDEQWSWGFIDTERMTNTLIRAHRESKSD